MITGVSAPTVKGINRGSINGVALGTSVVVSRSGGNKLISPAYQVDVFAVANNGVVLPAMCSAVDLLTGEVTVVTEIANYNLIGGAITFGFTLYEF